MINSKVKLDYVEIVRKELRRKRIRVQKWCKDEPENAYEAYINSRLVRIPIPVDTYSFLICLHEIGHIVKGERHYNYLEEYVAEQWCINRALKYGVIDPTYIHEAKVYVLRHCISDCMIHNLQVEQIRVDVLDWIGVSCAQLKELVVQNGMKMVMDFIDQHVEKNKQWKLMWDHKISRKVLTALK